MSISSLTALLTNITDYPHGSETAAELRAKAVLEGWLPAGQGELIHPDAIQDNK